jgi:uncharacterized membrane protein
MQVTTGGGDPAVTESGVVLNMVTKRGTNEWRGAGRLAWTGGELAGDREDRLDKLQAGSAELGGPLRRDNVWIWSAASRTEEDRVALGGGTEESVRDNANLKLNSQIGSANSITLLARRDEASGTGAGAAPHRAPETTSTDDGREDLWKVEDTHILSSNLYLTGALSENRGRSRSLPAAGSGGEGRIDAAGVARGSWFTRDEDSRTREAQLSGALFANTGPVSHEIRLGAQNRSLDVERLLIPPGRLVLAGETLGLPSGTALAEIWTGGRADAEVETRAVWAQDILSRDRAIFSLGLRWDSQDLGLPVVDPAEILAPRLGMTYAAGDERNLLLRASLGRFIARPGAEPILAAHPEAPSSLAFRLDPGEAPAFRFATARLALASDLAPEITDEAALSAEYALHPEMVLGLQGTWRRTSDVLEERWLVRDPATGAVFAAAAEDWLPAGSVDGVGWFDLRPGLAWTGSRLLANGDRRREPFDLAAFWQKRLSDHWMSRGHVAWHDWTWQTGPESTRFDDPTPALGGGDVDGQRVLLPFGDTLLPHERESAQPLQLLLGGRATAPSEREEEDMHAKARLFGHPIHQMLIVFPLGLLGTSLLFDILHLVNGGEQWALVSYYMIAAGIIAGLVAAPFGLIDWLAIPSDTRAKRIGLLHGGGNVVVLLLFVLSWFLRRDLPTAPGRLEIGLSVVAVLLALVTGWLGGELVDRLGIGVDEGANADAPSSLSHQPAHRTSAATAPASRR